MMDLNGRNAIITGASQGLGRAIAAAFLDAGASVLITARGEAALRDAEHVLRQQATRPGQQIIAMIADVGEPQDCAATAQRALDAFGSIDILVNNAGVYGPMGGLEEVDWDAWVDAIRINLIGTAQMCRAVIPHMRAREYGKIINLSGGGATAPLPRISAYAASKAAVVRLTETLAHELRDACVDINAIAPGALNTRLLDDVLQAGPEKVGAEFYRRSLRQRDEGGVPLAKGAELCVFLAAADSDGISGRLLSAVWDPWAELPSHRDALAAGDIYTLRRIVPEDRGQAW